MKAYQKLGVAASRVHAAAVPGAGWGWHREGRESAPGEVRLPEGLRPADGPPSLENTQDIHHHLLGVRVLGSGYTHLQTVYQKQSMLHSTVLHSVMYCTPLKTRAKGLYPFCEVYIVPMRISEL